MPPSRPFRIGLIGCGGIVQKTHLPCLLRLKDAAEIVAVADPLAARRAAVAGAAHLGPAACFADFPALLGAMTLDLVLIATPHHLHVPAATAAARRGVAIICEKPMATCLAEARALAGVLAETRVPFSVVHNFLYSPGNRQAQALLLNGDASTEKRRFGRAQSLFAKEEPLDPRDWRNQAQTGGGALNDTCYHELYQVEALVGSPITRVQARLHTVHHAISADDLVLLTLDHADGTLSSVTTAWAIPGFEGTYCEVHTDRRTIRVEGRGRGLRVYDRAARHWQELPLPAGDEPGVASGHFAFWQECLRTLREQHTLPVPAPAALRQVALLEAARESSRLGGRPVTVDARALAAALVSP